MLDWMGGTGIEPVTPACGAHDCVTPRSWAPSFCLVEPTGLVRFASLPPVTGRKAADPLGIGGTLDCDSTQTDPSPVTEIEVTAASNGTSTAFYDVAATFGIR
jgi:hypothetical protein